MARNWNKESALSYINQNDKNRGLKFFSAVDYLNHHTDIKVYISTSDGEVSIVR